MSATLPFLLGGNAGGGGPVNELKNGATNVARAAGDGGVPTSLGIYDQNASGWGALYGSNQELHYINPLGDDITIGALVRANNTLFVDPTYGNNSNALPDRADFPFSTVTAAIAAAAAGDTVVLLPGTHTNSSATDNFAKSGVTIYVSAGARWVLVNNVANRGTGWFNNSTEGFSQAVVGDGTIELQCPAGASFNAALLGDGSRAGFFVNIGGTDARFVFKVRELVLFDTNTSAYPDANNVAFRVGYDTTSSSLFLAEIQNLTMKGPFNCFGAYGRTCVRVDNAALSAGPGAITRGQRGIGSFDIGNLGDSSAYLVRPILTAANITMTVRRATNLAGCFHWFSANGSGNFKLTALGECRGFFANNSAAGNIGATQVNVTLENFQFNARLEFSNSTNSFQRVLLRSCVFSGYLIGAIRYLAGGTGKQLVLENVTFTDATVPCIANETGGSVAVFSRGTNLTSVAPTGTVAVVGEPLVVDAAVSTNAAWFTGLIP